MNPGQLDKRITLQSPSGSQDALGERITTWTDVATVCARIRGLTTREAMAAGQRQAMTSHMVEIRYAVNVAAITTDWRIKFGARFFTIDGVINVSERNEMFTLACTEGARTE